MEYGIDTGHEKGTFVYTASPLRISLKLPKSEVVLTDSKTLCEMPRSSIQYSVSTEGDTSSGLDLIITSQPDGEVGDGGQISLNANLSGLFGCPQFINIYGEQIQLSNCVVK